jgi:hypothetical protein
VTAAYTAIIVVVIGIQTYWISRSLGRVGSRLDGFEDRMHSDLQAHTQAITDLRERVARLEA